jgi:hypothetical protein
MTEDGTGRGGVAGEDHANHLIVVFMRSRFHRMHSNADITQLVEPNRKLYVRINDGRNEIVELVNIEEATKRMFWLTQSI